MINLMNRRRGFTLIELLVTISIIAVLTTLLSANFIGARQRGRDGQRKANLYQLQSALELYRADNGSYPVAPLGACGGQFAASNGTVYMNKIPCDPSSGSLYSYSAYIGASTCGGVAGTACTTYLLIACLENASDSEKDAATHASCSTASFSLTNP